MDNAKVWKLCNCDDFTNSEIIMEPKCLRDFAVHVVDGRHRMHSNWKTTKNTEG